MKTTRIIKVKKINDKQLAACEKAGIKVILVGGQ